jgi:hypothetical protein
MKLKTIFTLAVCVCLCLTLCLVSNYKLTIDTQSIEINRLTSNSRLLEADLNYYRKAYQEIQTAE